MFKRFLLVAYAVQQLLINKAYPQKQLASLVERGDLSASSDFRLAAAYAQSAQNNDILVLAAVSKECFRRKLVRMNPNSSTGRKVIESLIWTGEQELLESRSEYARWRNSSHHDACKLAMAMHATGDYSAGDERVLDILQIKFLRYWILSRTPYAETQANEVVNGYRHYTPKWLYDKFPLAVRKNG